MTDAAFLKRVFLALFAVGIVLLAWYLRGILLLAFAAVLIGILLTTIAGFVSRVLRLPHSVSVTVAVIALLALFATGFVLFGVQIMTQFTEITQTLPKSMARLQQYLQQREWGAQLLRAFEDFDLARARGTIMSIVQTSVSSLMDVTANLLVVFFGALYLAAQPRFYKAGLEQLVPASRRRQAQELLDTTGLALRQWLIGQILVMILVGTLVTIGLWLMDVRAALALGLIAALLEFVPIIGPILAAIPGVLFALSDSWALGFYVALFYIAVQQVEGYVIYPLIQRSTVDLPPILAIFAIVTFGLIFGTLGVLLAAPLTVLIMVWIKVLYLRDTLHEKVKLPGR